MLDFISEFDLKFDTDAPVVKLPVDVYFSVMVPLFETFYDPIGLLCTKVCCAINSFRVKLFVLWRIELCLFDWRPRVVFVRLRCLVPWKICPGF